jgi:endo-1,4-beta-xylanase
LKATIIVVIVSLITFAVHPVHIRADYVSGSLRQLADNHNLHIGVSVNADMLLTDPQYSAIVSREFNSITTENAFKFEFIHPSPSTYDFVDTDTIVRFAQSNNQQIRGHALIWYQQNPDWLTTEHYTRSQLISIMQNHIQQVMGRYQGTVYAWDVVNEPLNHEGTALRPSIWLDVIGQEYIELALISAHEADPEALLFINEYEAEELNQKSDALYELVSDLVARGIPIDGVGLQSHFTLDMYPNVQNFAANIKRFNDLGLIVDLTEVDVQIVVGESTITPETLQAQAYIYYQVALVCMLAARCDSFTVWGVTDAHSWVLKFLHPDSPLLFDADYQPKPAYWALLFLLSH